MTPSWPTALLRLELAPRALAAVMDVPALKALHLGEPTRTQRSLAHRDTPELHLLRAGIALCVRSDAGESRQQLTDDAKGRRFESASDAARPSLELAIASGWKAKRSLRTLDPQLVCAFRVAIACTARRVTFADGTLAGLSLEQYRLTADGRQPQERAALQLALDGGDVRRLYELAYDLVGEVPGCRVTTCAAKHWGYELAAAVRVPPRHAVPIEAKRKGNEAMLAQLAMREALSHAACNADGAFEGSDPEFVHQMRVGVRRLRVANRIARHAGLPTFSPRFRKELDWIWDVLGDARDREVFAHDTWPTLQGMHPVAAVVAARAQRGIDAARDRGHAQVRAALASARFQRLLLTAAWIMAHQEAAASGTNPRSARSLARKLLDRSRRRVLRRGRHIARLTPDERHALRRDAKKLRYLAAFAAPLYGRRSSRRFPARLAALQDVLGRLNDYEVATSLAQETLAGLPEPARRQLRSRLRASAAELEDKALADLGAAWGRLERARPFWRES